MNGSTQVGKVCLWVLIAIFALIILIPLCGSNSSSGTSKCTICGKKADTTFQGSGYCTKHYKDAVIWSAEKAWEKDND